MSNEQQKTEYLTDAQGRLVPVSTIRPEVKLEDDMVKRMIGEAEKLHKEIAAFKMCSFIDLDTFLQLLAESYKVTKGGKKGNVTFTSFDGQMKVAISSNDFLSFGPELKIAKDLIDECIKDWGNGQNSHIVALVNHAFRVDRDGRVNKDDILSLRRIDIQDDKWQRAMTAISDSIRVDRSRRYVRFYRRPAPDKDFEPILLDLSKVEA